MPDSGYCLQPSPMLAAPVPVYTGGAAAATGYGCYQLPPSPFASPAVWPAIDHRAVSPAFHRLAPSPSSTSSAPVPAPPSHYQQQQQQFYSPFPVVSLSPVAFVHHDPTQQQQQQQQHAAFGFIQTSTGAMMSPLPYQHPHQQQQYHQQQQQQLIDSYVHGGLQFAGMTPYHPGLAASTSVLTGYGGVIPPPSTTNPSAAAAAVGLGGGNGTDLGPSSSVVTGLARPLPASQRTALTPPNGDERQTPADDLLREISRLRDSLQTLESENASLTVKLNEQPPRTAVGGGSAAPVSSSASNHDRRHRRPLSDAGLPQRSHGRGGGVAKESSPPCDEPLPPACDATSECSSRSSSSSNNSNCSANSGVGGAGSCSASSDDSCFPPPSAVINKESVI